MDVFEVVANGRFSRDLLIRCNGELISALWFGSWKKLGRFSVDGTDYEIARDSIFSSELCLRLNETILCRTWIHGAWGQRADLTLDGIAYTVRWPAWKGYVAFERAGQKLGRIEPTGFLSGTLRAALPADVPRVASVFALWLVAYKRHNDSSA